ncbi:MAG TPA: hypothetical protein DCX54_05235, partial [Flavobacteriales bacterium]|nr:hypothetical protein [Flavobacteriales bacterium]
ISFDSRGYMVIPNPGIRSTRLYFKNSKGDRTELKLYGVNGGLSRHLFTESAFFDLDLTGLNGGVYIFSILQNGNSAVNGKILVE